MAGKELEQQVEKQEPTLSSPAITRYFETNRESARGLQGLRFLPFNGGELNIDNKMDLSPFRKTCVARPGEGMA